MDQNVPLTHEYGQLLKRCREEIRPYLSQMRLAEDAEMNHSMISRLETGKRFPSPSSVRALHQALVSRGSQSANLQKMMSAAGFYDQEVEPKPLLRQAQKINDALLYLKDQNENLYIHMSRLVYNVANLISKVLEDPE